MSVSGEIHRPSRESLFLVYETIGGHLDKQFAQIDSLNTRTHQLLGFATIAIGLSITLRPPSETRLISLLFAVAAVGFAFIAAFGVRAWAIRGWRHDPEPRPPLGEASSEERGVASTPDHPQSTRRR